MFLIKLKTNFIWFTFLAFFLISGTNNLSAATAGAGSPSSVADELDEISTKTKEFALPLRIACGLMRDLEKSLEIEAPESLSGTSKQRLSCILGCMRLYVRLGMNNYSAYRSKTTPSLDLSPDGIYDFEWAIRKIWISTATLAGWGTEFLPATSTTKLYTVNPDMVLPDADKELKQSLIDDYCKVDDLFEAEREKKGYPELQFYYPLFNELWERLASLLERRFSVGHHIRDIFDFYHVTAVHRNNYKEDLARQEAFSHESCLSLDSGKALLSETSDPLMRKSMMHMLERSEERKSEYVQMKERTQNRIKMLNTRLLSLLYTIDQFSWFMCMDGRAKRKWPSDAHYIDKEFSEKRMAFVEKLYSSEHLDIKPR